MVRQRPRKSVEELYTSKFDATSIKTQVSSGMPKTGRDRGDYSNYIITTNTPYNTNCAAAGGAAGVTINGASAALCGASSMATSRRKSARQTTGGGMKTDKYYAKEDKMLSLDEAKKEHNNSKKASRGDKNMTTYGGANTGASVGAMMYNMPNMYDNKNFVNFVADNNGQKVDHQNRHHHHHHHNTNTNDDDKEDDTEEFFELIRQTVENAIGKSISDLLNRNFRELAAKVDRFSVELKSTNTLLNKLQAEINNKVVHYGEENSRHFRYLCMKSEYDKMFYQHQTMIASNNGTSPNVVNTPTPVALAEKRNASSSKQNGNLNDCEKPTNSCTCRGNPKPSAATEPHKTSSEERSMSQKSSEMGMRDVLEHIQRFCTQFKMNELKCDDPPMPMPPTPFCMEDAMKLSKPVFEEDDDDFQMSSDGMTPRSDEHLHHSKYGGATMRSCSTTRGGTGGGDA